MNAKIIRDSVSGGVNGNRFLYSVIEGQGFGETRQMLVRDENDALVGVVQYPLVSKEFRVIQMDDLRYPCFRERSLSGGRVTLHEPGSEQELLEYKPKLGGERILQQGRVKFERNILEGPTWPIRADGDVVGHVQTLRGHFGANVNLLSMVVETPLIEQIFLLTVFDNHLAGGEI